MKLVSLCVAISVCFGSVAWADEVVPPSANATFYLQQADQATRDGRLVQAGLMIEWLNQNPDTVSVDDLALVKAEYAIAQNDIAGAASAVGMFKDPTRNICRQNTARGWVAANQNELNKAILALAVGTKHCPDDAGIWNLLGLAFVEKGESDAARQAFSKALLLSPSNPELINNHALALVQLGELPMAMQHLDDAVAKMPENDIILANRDFVSGMLGRLPIRTQRDNDTIWSDRLVNAGKGAQAADRRPEATALFSRALLLLDHFDDKLWSAMTENVERVSR